MVKTARDGTNCIITQLPLNQGSNSLVSHQGPGEKTLVAPLPPTTPDAYLPHGDVLELRGQGEDPEKLNFTQGGLQELVVGLHRLVGDVVVAGNAAQLSHLGGGRKEQHKVDMAEHSHH